VKNHGVAIANHNLVPSEALSAKKLDDSTVEKALPEDSPLLVDSLMHIEPPLLVDAVYGKKGVT
jgi:hypothetical protein